ncbi:hypothetical protein EYR41_003804 [Orbilia oligospora]|uniref:Uncharacterized protein n=1 Tax=Orbilia oligospora TaxID=2813651 RepID=A0A8H2E3J0_ORBOL|nr:hypothetical protein EYR41_003804 [Orbilia oligospora]
MRMPPWPKHISLLPIPKGLRAGAPPSAWIDTFLMIPLRITKGFAITCRIPILEEKLPTIVGYELEVF